MELLKAFASLNRRTYAGWDVVDIEWDGPTLTPRFRSRFSRHLAASVDLEQRLMDPDWHTEAFVFHYELGIHYGYPECCVLQFAHESTCLRPLMERRLGFTDYVPCDDCLETYLAAYIADAEDHLVPQAPVEP